MGVQDSMILYCYGSIIIRITNSNKSNRRVRILEVGMQLPESPETPFARRLPQHATVRVCLLSWWPRVSDSNSDLTASLQLWYLLFEVCSDVTVCTYIVVTSRFPRTFETKSTIAAEGTRLQFFLHCSCSTAFDRPYYALNDPTGGVIAQCSDTLL